METCPKCGHPRDGESCPKCGVVFERFDESVIEEGVGAEVLKLWSHVEEDWDDRARHALFVEQAILFNSVGYAAACYRRKGDNPMALEQLERLSTRLEQSLTASATEGDPKPAGRGMTIAIIIFVLIAAAGLAMYIFSK